MQREVHKIPVPGFRDDPSTIVVTLAGKGAMGDVSNRDDMKARLAPGVPFILVSVRSSFSGSGDQGVNDLQIRLDHGAGGDLNQDEDFDLYLDEWENMGFDSGKGNHKFGELAIDPDEYNRYAFSGDDHIVCTRAASGTERWAVEYRYIEAQPQRA